VVVPITGLGVALAEVTMVGGPETTTCAVPVRPDDVAVTVKGPPLAGPAVKTPAAEMVPPPETLHVTPGEVMGWPNWSLTDAVNACVAPDNTVAIAGETETAVGAWFTVTVTLLTAVWFAASRTVTVKV
jgi:hypothetical protein